MRLALATVLLLLPGTAHATYSIVAVDTATQQVGGAGTSCVGSNVIRIYGSVPGVGVAHAQAYMNQSGLNRSVLRLGQGVAPADILAEITAANFDLNADIRQYGIVDLQGRPAAFTGASNGDHASDRTGQVGVYFYSVQGNILTGRGVIDRTADAFEAGGCDLAERLLSALEAGAAPGEGDSRCTPRGIPSDSAFIQVDRPGEAAGVYLRLESDNATTVSPLVGLRQQLDAWRVSHPCPAPPDAGVIEDAMLFDAISDATIVDATIVDASAIDASPDAAIVDAVAGADATSSPPVTSDSSCDCTATDADAGGLAISATLLAFGRGLRRRARRGPPRGP